MSHRYWQGPPGEPGRPGKRPPAAFFLDVQPRTGSPEDVCRQVSYVLSSLSPCVWSLHSDCPPPAGLLDTPGRVGGSPGVSPAQPGPAEVQVTGPRDLCS